MYPLDAQQAELGTVDPQPIGMGTKRPRPVTPEPLVKKGGYASWIQTSNTYGVDDTDTHKVSQYSTWGNMQMLRVIQRWWRKVMTDRYRARMSREYPTLTTRSGRVRNQDGYASVLKSQLREHRLAQARAWYGGYYP